MNTIVDEIVRIDLEIAALQRRRKPLAAQIEAAALAAGDHEPLTEADREGRQVILTGRDWQLPVIFESDLVMASIPEGGQAHSSIIAAAADMADQLSSFWTSANKLERISKDGMAYRRQLREVFPPDIAAAVLSASLQRDKNGLPKSRTVIATDRAITIQPA